MSRTASTRHPACPSVPLSVTPKHRRGRQRTGLQIGQLPAPSHNTHAVDGESESAFSGPSGNDHRRVLFKYVTEVEASVVDSFSATAPDYVVEAMRGTVSSLLGTLPATFFEVSVSTIGDNLRSLMYSFLMTGYLFRNVEFHLEMKHGLERALPGSALQDQQLARFAPGVRYGVRSEAPDGYAEGANKSNIQGEVTRWNHVNGPETVQASEYIEMLEKEIGVLKERLSAQEAAIKKERKGGNALMEFIHSAPNRDVHDLTASAEVTEAMEMFLQRLLGTNDIAELRTVSTETSAAELGRLLFWLMIVGYTLRNMEVRFSMEQSYSLPYVSLEDKGLPGSA